MQASGISSAQKAGKVLAEKSNRAAGHSRVEEALAGVFVDNMLFLAESVSTFR
jgi:hypothetical protein